MSYILGLTGSIATGKSTVSKKFLAAGFPVVDADLGARVVVESGKPGLADIVTHFGKDFLLRDGSLNRKKLGEVIFADEGKRRLLDRLLKKHIQAWIQSETEKQVANGHALVILDIPLLFEAEYQKQCDGVMVVYVPEAIQLQRLMARDQLTKSEAMQRIRSQLSIEEKKALADFVIDNSGTPEDTEQQVQTWLAENRFA